jgi:hypothetical protein
MSMSKALLCSVLAICCVLIAGATPVAALGADYWRGGWRTPLGEAPHIYYFVIRGSQVSGAYCRNCSDATTVGFVDGTWSETAGFTFTVTFAAADGRVTAVRKQQARLADGRLVVTGASLTGTGTGTGSGTGSGSGSVTLTLVKDPRGADPGGAPAYHFPPGTPPAMPVTPPGPPPAGGGGGGGPRPAPPYWQPGPFKALRPEDVAGTWIAASFGPLGMNKQIFTFVRVGSRLRGVVCGRCDNTYTLATLEDIVIVGETLYFNIAHEDWGEVNPPTFGRQIAARVVQNEMIAAILGTNMTIDPKHPPAWPAGRPFTLVGPIAAERTRGNSSEGVDVWGPGTGAAIAPPQGRTPIRPVTPAR